MLYKKHASEIRLSFVEGDISAEQIARYFLDRIENFDRETQAFLTLTKERVFEKAKALDAKRASGQPLGKLAGIPIAIKDNIQIKGVRTTCGSKFLENYTSPFDATVIENIDREDGLILGKTNMDEFAMGSSTEYSAYQQTRNSWAFDRSPGGSSGGSAVAVSARLASLSLGSDTGGSIRQPAAFNGTVGFKPSFGRVSRYGLVAFGSSFDQIGPFGSCIEDVARMMEVLASPCARDATAQKVPTEPYLDLIKASIQGKKIGVPWEFLEGLSEEVQENFSQCLKAFKEIGVETTEIKLDLLKYSIPVYYILSPAEASTNLARFDGIRYGKRSARAKTLDEIYSFSRSEGFGAEVKKRIMIGTFVLSSGYQEAYYRKAQKIRTLIIREFQEAFEKCDVIAMPTTPTSAFTLGAIHDPFDMYLQDIYTISANLAGLPGINIPSGYCKEKRPLGVQILGRQNADANVLRYAYHFEKQMDLNGKIPPYFDRETLA